MESAHFRHKYLHSDNGQMVRVHWKNEKNEKVRETFLLSLEAFPTWRSRMSQLKSVSANS